MSRIYHYENGLPFTESLKTDVLVPITTKKRGIGCIIIDGVPGSGKTTLAVEICDYNEGKKISLDKNSHPQIAMGGSELIEKALLCHELDLHNIIYDEAGDFSKRSAITNFNKTLINFFEKCRALRINIFICIPNVCFLDNALFGIGVIDGLIHCYEKEENYTRFGVYDTESLGWLRYQSTKWPHHPWKAYHLCHPYMRGEFLPLSPDRDLLLNQLSTGDKVKSIRKSIEKKPRGRPKKKKENIFENK
jgi:hypothetical protein